MTKPQVFAVVMAVVALPRVASAESESEDQVQTLPCRPTIACTAEIVPAGAVEVETGYAQRRGGDAVANSGLALLKYSLTDAVQIQLGTNNLISAQGGDSTVLDGAYFGPKVVLHRQTELTPTLAVSALIMAPTRSGDAAVTRTTDAYLWAYASKDLPLGIHADLNFGLNVLSFGDKPASQFVAALSTSRDIGHGVGAMLEGYTFEGGGDYASHDAGVLMALSYSLSPRIMFDAGGDVALYRDARSMTLFAGVTFVPYQRTKAAAAPDPRELAKR